MNFKKFISGLSVLAITASAFAAMSVTAGAADLVSTAADGSFTWNFKSAQAVTGTSDGVTKYYTAGTMTEADAADATGVHGSGVVNVGYAQVRLNDTNAKVSTTNGLEMRVLSNGGAKAHLDLYVPRKGILKLTNNNSSGDRSVARAAANSNSGFVGTKDEGGTNNLQTFTVSGAGRVQIYNGTTGSNNTMYVETVQYTPYYTATVTTEPGATVTLVDASNNTYTATESSTSGTYSVNVPIGSYTVNAVKTSYNYASASDDVAERQLTVDANDAAEIAISLEYDATYEGTSWAAKSEKYDIKPTVKTHYAIATDRNTAKVVDNAVVSGQLIAEVNNGNTVTIGAKDTANGIAIVRNGDTMNYKAPASGVITLHFGSISRGSVTLFAPNGSSWTEISGTSQSVSGTATYTAYVSEGDRIKISANSGASTGIHLTSLNLDTSGTKASLADKGTVTELNNGEVYESETGATGGAAYAKAFTFTVKAGVNAAISTITVTPNNGGSAQSYSGMTVAQNSEVLFGILATASTAEALANASFTVTVE